MLTLLQYLIIILCSCQYGGVFQSSIRIQRLLGCIVCCSWNNTTQSTRKVSSLKERSSQISAKCQTIHKTIPHSYSTVHLATLAFSLAEDFSYVPCITGLLSIMVSITGFISSLIASICEDGTSAQFALICFSLATQHHYYPNYYIIFTHLSTIKY